LRGLLLRGGRKKKRMLKEEIKGEEGKEERGNQFTKGGRKKRDKEGEGKKIEIRKIIRKRRLE